MASIQRFTSLKAIDDGTNITLEIGGTKLFRFRKSDNQLQVQAGIDTDVSM